MSAKGARLEFVAWSELTSHSETFEHQFEESLRYYQ